MPEASVPARKAETLKDLLSRPATLDRIRTIAAKHVNPERLAKILLLTVARDFKLMRCTPHSLLAALMRCAQSGLEPDGRLVHFVPYKDQVQVIIDWKGLVEIARRNGIEAVAFLVREKDEISFMPDDGSGRCFLKHNVDPHLSDRGRIIGAYSRSRRIDGTGNVDYEWMTLEEIDAVRKRSAASNDGPWVTDFGEMARKTVLRRHSKRWPLTAEDRTAVDDDDAPENLRGRVSVGPPEPSRPLFGGRAIEDEHDDLDYTAQTETKSEPEPPPKKAEEKEAKPKAKSEAKADPPKDAAASKVEVVAANTNEPSARDRLREFVEADMQTTFEIFKTTVIELGHIPAAPSWNSFKDVEESDAMKLLNTRKGLQKAIEVMIGELKSKGAAQ